MPILKFVIDGNPEEQDQSLMPAQNQPLRELPPLPNLTGLPNRTFRFNKDSVGGELLWTINDRPFNPSENLANPKLGQPELWTFVNEGGGWTHPIHIHQEEHRIISRDGDSPPTPRNPDDVSREDVVALEGGESVTFYRNFRTFTGKYVAHCHNLSHEDHAMMFG